MLSFRDFIPADITKAIAVSRRYETLTEVLDRVNAWVAEQKVEVINVETVILPLLSNSKSTDTSRYTDNMQLGIGMFSFGDKRQQIARVWYRKN